ncbi:MAG TPA: 50S ribosomal protein L1 [Firmicutes bacterium]|jgi:large subunit ribosomal protein L1|nr:50S ribosomal protein L1 [Bacillota bacterium]
MKRRGRLYVEASKSVDKNKLYTPEEAVKLVKSLSKRKFDETVEVAMNLNVDTTKSDQQVRSSFTLPNGTGKTKRVLVVTKTKAEEAKNAGADFVGDDDIIEKIVKENWFDFDVMVATPEMMVSLGKIGKILGPKGLMPNPKTGTVTTNVSDAIANIRKGMVEYRADSNGNVHALVGKVSFDEDKLTENLVSFINEVIKNKPTGVKGSFVKNISISSTMGPGVKIDTNLFK